MRLLVFTHTFPPSPHPNAKRPYYVVRSCLERGWRVDVFTTPPEQPLKGAEPLTHPSLRIFRVDDPITDVLAACRRHSALYRVAALTVAGLVWPDAWAWWARKAFRLARSQPAYDRTLAFINPPSMLLSGRCPGWVNWTWTFDYQDSITPQQRRLGRRSPLQRALLPQLAALERQTLHQAGRIIFTATTNRQAYITQGLVPEKRTAHVPYFYDEAVFAQPPPAVRPDFEVVYFGTFDWRGNRNPETFLRALAQFLRQTPAARAHTRFVLYGSWLPKFDHLVDELNLRPLISIHPPVSYARYLELLRQSPILLLVVSRAHNLFMPSKIVDYLGACRPILAFVPGDSEVRQILEQAHRVEFTCDETDVAGGAAALQRLWTRYQANALGCDPEPTRFWSSSAQLPRYLELLEVDRASDPSCKGQP